MISLPQPHGYGVARRYRRGLVIAAFIISIGISIGLSAGLQALSNNWQVWKANYPIWFGTPSAIAVVAIIYSLFTQRAWAWGIASRRLSRVPDLRGTWLGTVTLTHLAGGVLAGLPIGVPQPCVLTVEQTVRRIRIRLYTAVSESASITASFSQDGRETTLQHQYVCEHKPGVQGFGNHEGACALRHSRRQRPTREGLRARAARAWRETGDPNRKAQHEWRFAGEYYTSPHYGDAPMHAGDLDVTWVERVLDRDVDQVIARAPTAVLQLYTLPQHIPAVHQP
jgi:hypothetical protein